MKILTVATSRYPYLPAIMVAAGFFVLLLVASGFRATAGVLIVPLEQEFAWSRTAISLAISVNLVCYGLAGPFSAAFAARFGLRRVVLTAMAVLALAALLATQITATWHLVVVWGLMVGTAAGMVGLSLSTIVVERWFTTHRGLVQGLLTASFATGQLVFLPALANLATNSGWRSACIMIAVAGLITLPVAWLFVHNRPNDVNAAKFGESKSEAASRNQIALARPVGNPLLMPLTALFEASKHLDFWLLFLTFFICGLSTNGLIGTHLIAACTDVGITPTRAAWVLAAMGIFDLFGTIGSGWLTDRFDSRILLGWYYGLRGLALLALPTVLAVGDYSVWLWVFALFYGLDWVATVPPTVRLATGILGRERVGMVFGWINTGHQIGAAVAAGGAGWIRTVYSDYAMAFILAGAACLLATLAALAVGRRGQKPETPSGSQPA
ncbi:MAG: MFS transporter [Candidatus Symbiobacter sp.]|nr:MFS transporter [Candidatus Symbiobacter sp.]